MIFHCTPIQELPDTGDNKIYLKRDDLLPVFFGGNKVRIANEFFSDMKKKNCNCVIGYGNARSNMSRAIANMAFRENIPCYIVSPNDENGMRIETINSRIVSECGAVIKTCNKNQVSETVEKVMKECKSKGYSPYYIYGDKYGKGNEEVAVKAYENTYCEIIDQIPEFNYIFLATGTGMTQAGLLVGKNKTKMGGDIIGISVSRNSNQEREIIKSYLSACGCENDNEIIVDDNYLCGGYGKYNHSIISTIDHMFMKYGIPFDPTYTGKAYYGMKEYIKKNNISGKKILFLHTGGTPLFYDYFQNRKIVEKCTNRNDFITFLKQIDYELPIPLSSRVNLLEYAEKTTQNGYILTIRDSFKIIAAVVFYANDNESKKAYLSLLVSMPEYRNRGFASILMDKAEFIAKQAGMKEFILDTDLTNDKALSFYKKRSYNVISKRKKYKMRKWL